MRYLSLLLLAPWLLILGWVYWAYPKRLPRPVARRLFDLLALLLTAVAVVQAALLGFDMAVLPGADRFGQAGGAIWQQVLPALCGYAAFAAMLLLASLLRHLIWRRRR